MARFQKCPLSLVTPEGSSEEHRALVKLRPTFLLLPFPFSEAVRAGGLWEAAESGGAASARDDEAAAGPEPEEYF